MRATFAGLNTMVRGIVANQLALDTTGHNITNAGTDGYSRQKVILATTYGEQRASLYGNVMVGTGVDALAVERARNVYADIQYRNENPTQQYYKTLSVNYDKLETIFDDSKDLGIEKSINDFYQTWVDLSTTASNASERTHVIEQGRNLSEIIQSKTAELQEQIRSQYEDIKSEVGQIDDILNEIVSFNKQIVTQEVTGATANDLRDNRDLLVDQLSSYINISVTENEFGAYQINSGGVTLVNGSTRGHLLMSNPVPSVAYGIDYGLNDYSIKLKESDLVFLPQNGILKARFDAIDENKAYIDKLANLSSFLLSVFNDQHKQGWDMFGNSKFVDEDGKDVTVNDESTLSSVEYLDPDGKYVTADNVNILDGNYYDKTVTLTKTGDKYYNGTDEVSAANVVTKKDGNNTTYYLKVIKQNADTKYLTSDNKIITKVPDTINFYGKGSINYQFRYDAHNDFNYLYKDDDEITDESKKLLSGVQIIAELEVNTKFSEIRGERYLAAATSYDVIETQDENKNINRSYLNKQWGERTGDGTNAVYLSELFNIAQETVISDGKANALVYEKAILRDKEGNPIRLDAKSRPVVVTDESQYSYATAMSKLSINSYYQQSMSHLGIDAYSTDVNYEAMDAIMIQVNNWRDSTSGVDWNEELTHMIQYQKGFSSCSRCLNAMDEMLEKLVNSTGVVGR